MRANLVWLDIPTLHRVREQIASFSDHRGFWDLLCEVGGRPMTVSKGIHLSRPPSGTQLEGLPSQIMCTERSKPRCRPAAKSISGREKEAHVQEISLPNPTAP